jgi:hypothetical protein
MEGVADICMKKPSISRMDRRYFYPFAHRFAHPILALCGKEFCLLEIL